MIVGRRIGDHSRPRRARGQKDGAPCLSVPQQPALSVESCSLPDTVGRVPAGSSIRHHLLDVLLRLSSSAAAGWRFEAARCGRKAQNGGKPSPGRLVGVARPRSEEHTSELQSLMRISYAVFCLNKKTHTNYKNK